MWHIIPIIYYFVRKVEIQIIIITYNNMHNDGKKFIIIASNSSDSIFLFALLLFIISQRINIIRDNNVEE